MQGHHLDDESPLFLDEPPGNPVRPEPDRTDLDALFADEMELAGAPVAGASPAAAAVTPLATAWRADDPLETQTGSGGIPARTVTYIAVILLGAVVGFALALSLLS